MKKVSPTYRFFKPLWVILWLGWLLGGGSFLVSSPAVPPPPKKNYNILVITLDTLRYDHLSVYSSQYVKTPVIDRLASQAVVFDRAFSHNPVTLPAHVNIFTGTTPNYHGISDNTGFRLDERFLTLAEYLKGCGFHTGAFIGAFPLDSRFGLQQGFDHYDDQYGTHNPLELFFVERPAAQVIAPAVQWIAQQKSQWFAWVHLFDAHQPYMPPPPYDRLYSNDLYAGEIAYLDAALKTLFDFLTTNHLLDNTIIVITGDHGEALGEKGEDTHSYFAYNNTLHIPLIIYVPAGRAQRIKENVCHIDIFPTLCELLGTTPPAHLQGQSLVPLMAGKPLPKRDIYFESLTPYLTRGWAPLRGFLRGDLKFIQLPIPEVYNILNDPSEKKNLAAQSNVIQLNRDLVKLKLSLQGKNPVKRSQKSDSDTARKLKSLGYLTSTGNTSVTREFTPAQDLKTLLPLQNRMQDALDLEQQGKHEQALNQLQKIVTESPGFILVYRYMSEIYSNTGRVAQAVQILERGLKKNPDNVELISNLGIALVEFGKPAEAILLLQFAIEKESFNPENYNYLGAAYYKKGELATALENYQKALALDNNYASVYNNIGSLYLTRFIKEKDENAYTQALANFSRALAIDPRLFAAYNGRGAAYQFKGNITQAIADWEKALTLNPSFIDAYFNIAIAYLRVGQRASALTYLRTCKERFFAQLPANEQARLMRLLAEAEK